jgi:hypothetical protein
MSDKQKSTQQLTPPTVITLTLPHDDSIERQGRLLIARGDLAHVRQFTYTAIEDVTAAIKDAYIALAAVEAEPPVIPEAPKTAPMSKLKTDAKTQPKSVVNEEPTIDIPIKKGTLAVKISHLKIVAGETDAAAYRQAVLIAGKLIDGKLWDGQSPIRIDDVYATMKKMKHLSEREMSLFTLEDFVQVGDATEVPEAVADVKEDAVQTEENSPNAAPFIMVSSLFNRKPSSKNGHHTDGATAK